MSEARGTAGERRGDAPAPPAELEDLVTALARPGGRQVGSAGHLEARRFLLEEMAGRGLIGYHDRRFDLTYRFDGAACANLVGVLPGSDPELEPVLLGAHYDTCGPIPGADDNAAGVAILLAAVARLAAVGLERSLLFAFFDAEEPPYYLSAGMGSTYFYRHQRREPVHCALILDLVGHDVPVPGWEDLVFVTGMESDPELEPIFRELARASAGIRTLPTLTRYIGDMSDYHAFRADRRPYLFVSCGRSEHYHLPSDTADKLNYSKMGAILDYLVELTRRVAATSFEGPFEGYDTTPTELEYFQTIAAPLLARFGARLRNRADLDRFVARLIAAYGLN